uniref:Cadherin domain-containing protein n=2 Tax=Parascaris univalens TaxID=6257 RepID=A0A915AY47_PARUN
MMDDSTQQHDYVFDSKIVTTMHQSSRGHKKHRCLRMHPVVQLSQSSASLTRMQTIQPCESMVDLACSKRLSRLGFQQYHNASRYCQHDFLPIQSTKSTSRDSPLNMEYKNMHRRRYRFLSLVLFSAILTYSSGIMVEAQDLSLPFVGGQFSGQSRFMSYAGKAERDIVVTFIKNISEDTPVGELLATFKAEDISSPTYNLTFRINRQTDPKRQFSIDQSGSLRVAQRLDREDIPRYSLIVEAFDPAGNVGSQRIDIYVQDVNDNAPIPYTVPNPCVFMENTDPAMQPKCEIYAHDPDTAEYGPPFVMSVAPDFKYGAYLSVVFDPSGDNGNGSMTVTAKQRFDREAEFPGKKLEIPIILSDRGGLKNERSVYIIIGDENDNPMKDGTMTIFVNSYRGRLGRTMIGRVYVEDKDDWDLPDKTFTWAPGKSLPGFELASNGEITMDANMPPRTYHLVADVVDSRRNEHALGTVNVIVKLVPEIAFMNQGGLRILMGSNGLNSPDEFIRADSSGSSPMSRFLDKMNDYLGGTAELDVFSIKKDVAVLQTTVEEVVDVRFTAHGSPYRSPVLLNGLIAQHRDELQQAIGANIVSAGIDMCKFTVCDMGCETKNYADETGILVSANQTVIVGVNAWSNDTCTCPVFTPPSSCQADLCLNNGVCHNVYPSGFFCECRNNALKGFRCQGTTRSFDGQGFAWFKQMPACTSLNISLQFMTRQADGLLLYNGPMGDNTSYGQVEYRDYIIIRLVSGRVEAELMFNGVAPNPIQVAGSDMLNDGKWHTVALTQSGKTLELVVDNCYTIGALSMMQDGSGFLDDSSCRRVITSVDDDERLNINTPLQLGGLAPLSGNEKYPPAVTGRTQSFVGCVRNLVVNSEMYDLGVPDYVNNEHSQMGCDLNEAVCDINSVYGGYCIHGECIADAVSTVPKCACDPGWGGDRCDSEISWIEFGPGAFVEYDVKVGLEDKTSDVDVLFLPGKGNGGTGELGFGSSGDKYVSTSIESYIPTAKFDLSPFGAVSSTSTIQVRMKNLQLLDNSSYWMQFSRSPVRSTLSIDGVYHKAIPLDPTKTPYEISISQLLLGAESVGGARGFQGCVGTFRWQHINLPLSEESSFSTGQGATGGGESIISIKQARGVSVGCSQRTTCATVGFAYCGGSYVCVDFWKGPFCTCPAGAQALLGPDGQLAGCGATLAVSSLGISSPAVILILTCLILLILLVLLMVVYTRRQTPPFEPVRPEDLNRDNLRPYDVEGGGEADNDQYNISNLRKPVIPIEGNGIGGYGTPVYPPPTQKTQPVDDKLNSRIKSLEADPDATAPYDELRIYDDEGDNVSRVTLESLESADENGTAGNLNEEIGKWGPRFNNLADIYGKGEK